MNNDMQKNIRRTACGRGWIVESRHVDDRRWVQVYVGGDYAAAMRAYRAI